MLNMKSFFEFFENKLTIVSFYGTPARIDYRWILIFTVLVIFSGSSFPSSITEDIMIKFLFGTISILLFFLSILFHEFIQTYIAKKEGIEIIEVQIYPFGGIPRFRREPETPESEFKVAVAGPLASFFIAFFFLGLRATTNGLTGNLLNPLFYTLFFLNLLLAILNLFPGYPLDGGRILRAFLRQRGTDINDATKLAGKCGQIIAITLIISGIVFFLTNQDGSLITQVWIILVGIFLFDAARKTIQQVDKFKNLTVDKVMEMPVAVKPDMTVMQFVDKFLPLQRLSVFPVAENNRLIGFLFLKRIKKNLPRDKWHETKVRDVMLPIKQNQFVETDTSIVEVKELLRTNGIGVLGVVDDKGDFVGLVKRGKIRRRN